MSKFLDGDGLSTLWEKTKELLNSSGGDIDALNAVVMPDFKSIVGKQPIIPEFKLTDSMDFGYEDIVRFLVNGKASNIVSAKHYYFANYYHARNSFIGLIPVHALTENPYTCYLSNNVDGGGDSISIKSFRILRFVGEGKCLVQFILDKYIDETPNTLFVITEATDSSYNVKFEFDVDFGENPQHIYGVIWLEEIEGIPEFTIAVNEPFADIPYTFNTSTAVTDKISYLLGEGDDIFRLKLLDAANREIIFDSVFSSPLSNQEMAFSIMPEEGMSHNYLVLWSIAVGSSGTLVLYRDIIGENEGSGSTTDNIPEFNFTIDESQTLDGGYIISEDSKTISKIQNLSTTGDNIFKAKINQYGIATNATFSSQGENEAYSYITVSGYVWLYTIYVEHINISEVSSRDVLVLKITKVTRELEVVLNSYDYDNIINTDDGLINKLDAYSVYTDTSRTEYKEMANDIKFIRLTKTDGSSSAMFNIVFNMPKLTNPVFCGYCFNKLNENQLGIGYLTVKYTAENTVSITSVRSTMYIDGKQPDSANGGIADKLGTKLLTNENLNDIKDTNFSTYYTTNFEGTNKPSNVSYAFGLVVMRTFSNNYKQIITDATTGVIYERYFRNATGAWSSWRRILTEDDLNNIDLSNYYSKSEANSTFGSYFPGFGTSSNSAARGNHTHSEYAATSVATAYNNGLMSSTDKGKLDGIASNANKYILPAATASTLGGIKLWTGTLEEYGNITTIDNNTLYCIQE